MRTKVLIVAGVTGLLSAAHPAQAQFYRWRPYSYYRPFYPYAYPFYPPPIIYAVPPPVYYPPPIFYGPPPIPYERRSSFRRPHLVRRPVQRASVPVAPGKLAPTKLAPPTPSHDLYPPERSTN